MKSLQFIAAFFLIFTSVLITSCETEPLDSDLLAQLENGGGTDGGDGDGDGTGGGTGGGGGSTGGGTGGGTSYSGYAMTASINGISFNANNPYGNNNFSSTNIWGWFPEPDYIMLQGRQGGLVGGPEIDIWLKVSDIIVGTYPISFETFETPPSHFIDLVDNSNDEFEYTKDGAITITEVNTTLKTVKGTFSFRTTDEIDPTAPVNFTITNGKFYYKYAK